MGLAMSPQYSFRREPGPHREVWRRAYVTRMMLSLVGSLTLVTICFKLPFYGPERVVGWQLTGMPQHETIDLVDIRPQAMEGSAGGVPITRFGESPPEGHEGETEDVEKGSDGEEILPAPVDPTTTLNLTKLDALGTIHEFSEERPEIDGGLPAYYIHIKYPQEAVDQGIEGRMMLSFVVETDGYPSNIEVLQSLHPLCDSSAVQALRRTRFIPGKQRGEAVRVRMRLPVRFRLVEPGTQRKPNTQVIRNHE